MAYGSRSGVYQALLFGMKLSSMGMIGGFKSGIPQSTGKDVLDQSKLTYHFIISLKFYYTFFALKYYDRKVYLHLL